MLRKVLSSWIIAGLATLAVLAIVPTSSQAAGSVPISGGSTGGVLIERGTCDITSLMSITPANVLFPLIPANMLHVTTSDGRIQPGTCPPMLWGLDVARYFLYKALAFGQWLALALALILTVYAGVLYLGGFASEANVKKAKTVLIATYVGLAIIILARVIMYGSIQLVAGNQYNPYTVPTLD